jgi:hypothetical protein
MRRRTLVLPALLASLAWLAATATRSAPEVSSPGQSNDFIGPVYVDVAEGTLAVPRIELGFALSLPREIRKVTLTYAPPAGTRPVITDVRWEGATPLPETPEGYPATVEFRGAGQRQVNLRVTMSTHPGQGGPPLAVDDVFRLDALDVPADRVAAVIDYPGAASTPPVDLNGDFNVDESDLQRFWEDYGHRRGDPAYSTLADWDANGTVDLTDLVRFVDAYQGWKGRDIGPTYGNGLVLPVAGRPFPMAEYSFGVPASLFRAHTEPAGMEPWIEWRTDGVKDAVGAVFSRGFTGAGEHVVSARMFSAARDLEDSRKITIYSARITNFKTGDIVENGVDYTFEAATDPPGFEEYVNWFASTKFGTVSAFHGRGATFKVRFDGTWGTLPTDPPIDFQWLGVQADNSFFNQDQKNPVACSVDFSGPDCLCVAQTVTYTAVGTPGGGTYAWAITAGGTRASIVGPANQPTVNVRGDAVSAAAKDITLQVTYTPPGKAACSKSKQLTVASVSIAALTRPNECDGVSPTKDKVVQVTITPDLTGTGCSYLFDVINGSATNGTATVTANATRTSSGPITVTGGNQTAIDGGAHLQVRGSLNQAGNCPGLSPVFAVCAHPTNFRQTVGEDAGGGNLHFKYEWESDSGNIAHLDGVWVDERVTYPGGADPFVPPNPPFCSWSLANPTITPDPPITGSTAFFDDNHGNLDMISGTAGAFDGTQYYRYRCRRCPPAEADRSKLAWGVTLMGPITIARVVEQVPNPNWRYRITKSGVTATKGPLPAPPCP